MQLERKKIRRCRRALSAEEVKVEDAEEQLRAAKKKVMSSLDHEDGAEAPRKLVVDEAVGEAEKAGRAVAGGQRTKAKHQQQRWTSRANRCLRSRSRSHPPKPTTTMMQKSASFAPRLFSTPQLRHATTEPATFVLSE